MRRNMLGALACTFLWLVPGAAQAQAESAGSLSWQPQWREVSTEQYVYMSTLIVAEAFLEYGPVSASASPSVKGPWPGDQKVRDLLRVDDPQTELAIDTLDDWLWWSTLAFPIYADALLSSAIVHGNTTTAWQLTAISLQGLLTVTLISRILHVTVRRQRPVYYQAEQDGVEADTTVAESLSFPGGHAATAFAGAGLACSFHRHLPLFGGGWPNDAVCPTVLTLATAAAVMRVMIDRHYFSDTLVGAGLGFAVGYLLPELLHFGLADDGTAMLLPAVGTEHAALRLRLAW